VAALNAPAAEVDLLVVILTYNSAAVIDETVRAALQVSPLVLIVDSHSTDSTRERATQLGCRVVVRDFVHYADQRNWAIAEHGNAHAWQLHLDADEVLDMRAIEAIRVACMDATSADGFIIRRLTYFMGKPLRFAGEHSWHLRLFRSGTAVCEDRLYDQHFICNGSVRRVDGLLHDKNVGSLSEWTSRHNRWSDLEAAELRRPATGRTTLLGRPSRDPRVRRRLLKGWYYRMPTGWRALAYFLYRYFGQLGFLDGRIGFFYCCLQAFWFRVLIDAKLEEGERSRSSLRL